MTFHSLTFANVPSGKATYFTAWTGIMENEERGVSFRSSENGITLSMGRHGPLARIRLGLGMSSDTKVC